MGKKVAVPRNSKVSGMNLNQDEIRVVSFYAEHRSVQGVSQGVLAVLGDPDHPSGWVSKLGIFRIGFKRLAGQPCPECPSQNVARALGMTLKTLQCLDCGAAWDR